MDFCAVQLFQIFIAGNDDGGGGVLVDLEDIPRGFFSFLSHTIVFRLIFCFLSLSLPSYTHTHTVSHSNGMTKDEKM
jgi:hypothetical protein